MDEECVDGEFLALDIAFPYSNNGDHEKQQSFVHDVTKPVYLVLHGLNGGSHEEYVMEFVLRRQAEGSTVVVLVARGLMDLPLKGWNLFHGARTMDVHSAATAGMYYLLEKYDADLPVSCRRVHNSSPPSTFTWPFTSLQSAKP